MKQKNPNLSDAVSETWKDPQVAAARRRRDRVEWERNGIVYPSFYQAARAAGVCRTNHDHKKPRRELKKLKEEGSRIEWRGEVFILRGQY